MKKTAVLLMLLAITGGSFSFNDKKASRHFTLQKLSDGVWAALNNDHYGHAICNAGIIDLGDKTVIFDPFMNLDAATDLKRVAKELTGKEANIIINSHYHNDHIRGNQVFVPASIISTSWTRKQISISEPEELAWEKSNAPKLAEQFRQILKTGSAKEKEEAPLWIGYYEAMVTNGPLVKTTLPTITFDDSLWIHGSQRSLFLKEYKNGHSGSDAVMVLPKEGIVFMGDLLFEKRHPYLGDGNPESWMNHLDLIYADSSLKVFVPGHGGVTDKTTLKEMSGYIRNVKQLVTGAIQKGQHDSVTRKLPMPGAYEEWKFGQFFGFNVGFLIRQARL